MNAIEDNPWSQGFARLGEGLTGLRAILCISAHWVTSGLKVTAQEQPKTIHDFGGFPRALYEVQYPAPGSPSVAAQIEKLLAPHAVSLDTDWGLDHGTWSVLRHLRPNADVPVLQLSLDSRATPEQLFALGQQLRPLREQGVLILGSGNIVHNLPHAFQNMRRGGEASPPAWATNFDRAVERCLQEREPSRLSSLHLSPEGRVAHPTAEHYLPLLVACGASTDNDTLSFPIQGFDLGSISMRSVRFG